MSKAAQSIFYFGIYLLLAGAGALLTPNLLASIFQLDAPTDGWVHFTGALAIWLAIYYILCARNEVKVFFRATVFVRPTVLITLIVFVLLGLFKPGIILIGVVDTLGAVWTWWALRQDEQNQPSS